MVLTLVISLLVFLSIILSIVFFPKIKIGKIELSSYWLIALIGAILMIATLRVSFADVLSNLFDESASINPIKILALFFSMTFISVFLDHAGFFSYLANLACKKAGKNQFKLFTVLYFLVAILTIFTSNDIVILTLTPFICCFAKNAKINPLPYLIAEFAAANTWSMMLIIGNPTNIYLGSMADITFGEYFSVMALPTCAAGLVEFLIIYFLFKKSLSQEINVEIEEMTLKNKVDVIVGLSVLIICILLLALSNLIGFEMWLISVIIAGALLLYFIVSRIITKNIKNEIIPIGKKLPWQLIPFVISMFVIVISLNQNGVSDLLRNLLGNTNTIWTYGPSSFLVANLINNIPMSILYSSLPTMTGYERMMATYASIAGSNIGAFLTPIGALAGIMFNSLLKEHDVKLSFKQFSFYGVIVAIPTFLIALAILSLILA
ncbi:MAG: hypothetical protein MJ248_03130 [Bacilli bacterium]|nr:hypothetical protein [Bacilli bacterium]